MAGVAVVAVAALVFGLLRSPGTPTPQPPEVAVPAPGDRLLQSVDIAQQGDGSLSGVTGTVVIARAAGSSTDTVATTYDPAAVVDKLPLRVLTTSRTDTRSGTNLSALTGYTGQVRIDVTVQNPTVKAQRLRYDVAGHAKRSTAMVGAPLTVVASAALPGTSPAAVVTAASDGSAKGDTTNGVLSRSTDNTTQVQWATILAPPQLAASATLRLVVDAKDFALPRLDLTVQPGLVTDPSVGALVDAAFDPKSSDEVALEARTLKLVGNVNGVLDEATDTIATVRKTLDTTSETLGTKTVSSLRSSTANVTTSVKSSRQNLQALNKELRSSVTATNSATLSQMSATVDQLDQLLGDTSAKASPVKLTGSGCEQKVTPSPQSASVYGSLLQVSAQLDAYADATKACKEELQQTIKSSIGPALPTDDDCRDSAEPANPSVTCTLHEAEKTVGTFITAGQQAVDDLSGTKPTSVASSITTLTQQLQAVADQTDKLVPNAGPTTIPDTLKSVDDGLDGINKSIADLSTSIESAHVKAVDARTSVDTMIAQNADVAAQLCALVGDGNQPGRLSAAQVDELRRNLTSRSCPDQNGVTVPLLPPVKYGGKNLDTRLHDQASALDAIAAATDVTGDHKPLTEVSSDLDTVRANLGEVVDALGTGDQSLQDKITALQTSVHDAQTGLTSLNTNVTGVETRLDAALKQADAAGVNTTLDTQIARIVKRTADDSDEVGTMFESSRAGLAATAAGVQADGKKSVDKQRKALQQTQSQAESSLTESTKAALGQVAQNVGGATKDLDATKTLLTRELTKVLLDLGSPTAKGSGVLGTLATSAKAAGAADSQLSEALDTSSSYASVRARDLDDVLLRQAQAEAALQRQADLPAFVLPLPATVAHQTVYVVHLAGTR